jgi:chemotaxis protein MotB
MNIATLRTGLVSGALLSTLLLGGCVSQGAYDDLKAQNGQLQQQVTAQQAQIDADKAQIARLQGAIAYTVNSDLLFAPGGYQMSAAGKKLIAQYAAKLAPTQTSHLLIKGYTDNAPIGPALAKEGITSNQILSQKRADNVRDYLISQGVKAELVDAKGFGESEPVASNATAAGRKQNRRVVVTLAAPAG